VPFVRLRDLDGTVIVVPRTQTQESESG
jgi:hypothetical protein